MVTFNPVRIAWRKQISTLVRCMVDSHAPMFAFHEYGLSRYQSYAIVLTRVSAVRSPLPAATIPWPSQRSEWNHMYQLAFLYGFDAQLMLPRPVPTLTTAYGPHWNLSLYRFVNGFVFSIPLNPGHV